MKHKDNLGDMTLRGSDCARSTRLLPLSLNKCHPGSVFVRETCFLSEIYLVTEGVLLLSWAFVLAPNMGKCAGEIEIDK
jgi:hypothetical protein